MDVVLDLSSRSPPAAPEVLVSSAKRFAARILSRWSWRSTARVSMARGQGYLTSRLLVVALAGGSTPIAAQAPSGGSAQADLGGGSEVGATLPGAPTIGVATVGNNQLTVAFSAPAFTGGAIITGYNVVCDPGAISVAGSGPPIVVTGLVNDTTYRCTVRATSVAGAGAPSAPIAAVPRSPAVTAFAGSTANGERTVTLSMRGGGPTCRLETVSLDAPAAAPPAGVSFPEGVIKFVAADCGPGSILSFALTLSAPLPPGAQYWNYGRTTTDHSPHWYTLPAQIDGSTITYRIADGGLGDDDLAVNGIVAGTGGLGVGTLGAAPTPFGLTATAGNGRVSLRWNAVASATGYTVKRATAQAGPYTSVVTALSGNAFTDKSIANGTTYFYSVSAHNSEGESADSAQVQVTPFAPTGCGVEPVTEPQTAPCPPDMAGTYVEQEVYVCDGTQWRSTGRRVTESTCTPLNFGSAPPATN
jgi:Fibronectin type III domain